MRCSDQSTGRGRRASVRSPTRSSRGGRHSFTSHAHTARIGQSSAHGVAVSFQRVHCASGHRDVSAVRRHGNAQSRHVPRGAGSLYGTPLALYHTHTRCNTLLAAHAHIHTQPCAACMAAPGSLVARVYGQTPPVDDRNASIMGQACNMLLPVRRRGAPDRSAHHRERGDREAAAGRRVSELGLMCGARPSSASGAGLAHARRPCR